MISDPVERWKSRLGDSTWGTYENWWSVFLKHFEIVDAAELLKFDIQKASDLAADFYNWLKREGYSSKSCNGGYVTVRSFYSHNGIKLEKMDSKFQGLVELESRVTLTQKQVFDLVYEVSNVRDRGAVSLCFQGGQRDGVVSCLKVGNITTRNWETAGVVIFDVPAFLPDASGRNVNKRCIDYRFGILNDAAAFIAAHLQERRVAGEQLTSESWLFRSHRVHRVPINYSSPIVAPIQGTHINRAVTEAAERLGIQTSKKGRRGCCRAGIHAQMGRRYFNTQLRVAGVDSDLRNFLMGHKVGYGGAYDQFDETEIIAALESARSRLTFSPHPLDEVERKKQMILDSLRQVMNPDRFVEMQRLVLEQKSLEGLNVVLAEIRR